MAARAHEGEGGSCEQDGGAAVEVDHVRGIVRRKLGAAADAAEACGVDEPTDLRLRRLREELRDAFDGGCFREVAGEDACARREQLRDGREAFLAAGDEPDLVESFAVEQTRIPCAEAA